MRAAEARSAVAREGLREQPQPERLVRENVREPDFVAHALHPRLHELELLGVAEAHLVEPLRLRLAHVARCGPARGIGVLVVVPQRLPVLIAGTLDRLADVLAGERHGIPGPGSAPHFSATGFTSSGAPATSVGASAPGHVPRASPEPCGYYRL